MTRKSLFTLLDLFCGAGGACRGYQRAGFHVTGVDQVAQKRYVGDVFVLGDALQYLARHGAEYDVIHASPPCQAYSALRPMTTKAYPDLVAATRTLLRRLALPWVIENVPGAPLFRPLLLCGSMFRLETSCGAQLRRHRLFESNLLLLSPGACEHGHSGRTIGIYGHSKDSRRRTIMVTGATPRDPRLERQKYREAPQRTVERSQIREAFCIAEARTAMGIDWMVMAELSQAIPPAYTEWIGRQLHQAVMRQS